MATCNTPFIGETWTHWCRLQVRSFTTKPWARDWGRLELTHHECLPHYPPSIRPAVITEPLPQHTVAQYVPQSHSKRSSTTGTEVRRWTYHRGNTTFKSTNQNFWKYQTKTSATLLTAQKHDPAATEQILFKSVVDLNKYKFEFIKMQVFPEPHHYSQFHGCSPHFNVPADSKWFKLSCGYSDIYWAEATKQMNSHSPHSNIPRFEKTPTPTYNHCTSVLPYLWCRPSSNPPGSSKPGITSPIAPWTMNMWISWMVLMTPPSYPFRSLPKEPNGRDDWSTSHLGNPPPNLNWTGEPPFD